MNITLFKKHNNNRFSADIFHSYWATPIKYCGGLYSNFKNGATPQEGDPDLIAGELNAYTLPINCEEIEDAEGMFFCQAALTGVKADFSKVKNIKTMFSYCYGLETIEADFSSLTGEKYTVPGVKHLDDSNIADTIGSAFLDCKSLKTIKCNFSNLTRISNGDGNYGFNFNNSTNLTTVECNFQSLGNTAKETYKNGALEPNDPSVLFKNCTKIETFKCNFNSLENADNLLKNCTELTTFDCEFGNLNSAINLCPKAKLTLESISNIAEKIKKHNPDETHRIDLGIGCPNSSEYIFGWSSEVNKILAKNWEVGIKLSDSTSIDLSKYTNESIISVPETNTMNFITGNQTSQQKYGFVMLSENKNTIVNRIKIKTSVDNNNTVCLRVHDYNKNVIAISNPITITTPGEYTFEFNKPFILEKNIQTVVDDSNSNIINNVINDRKYYLDFINENKTARTELKIVFCDVERGYGAMYNQNTDDFSRQFSMEEDEYPGGPDGNSEDQRTIYSELWAENIDCIVLTNRVSEESPISIIFTPNDDTVINSVVAHFKKAGEPPMEDGATPINITSTLINEGKSAQINMSKNNETGEYIGVIEIKGTNNKNYYKHITLIIE